MYVDVNNAPSVRSATPPPSTTAERAGLRHAFGKFATGVTIVTTRTADGRSGSRPTASRRCLSTRPSCSGRSPVNRVGSSRFPAAASKPFMSLPTTRSSCADASSGRAPTFPALMSASTGTAYLSCRAFSPGSTARSSTASSAATIWSSWDRCARSWRRTGSHWCFLQATTGASRRSRHDLAMSR